MNLVTIDFHNTLFQCDDWFRLEIETLPIVVLQRLQHQGLVSTFENHRDEALRKYRSIRERATSTGIECDAEASIEQVLQHLEIGIEADVINETVETIMWDAVNSAEPIDGAAQLVQTLANGGITLAVVSSAAYHPFLEWCLERFEMRADFSHVVTSASCGIYKSNPDIYRHTMKLAEATPPDSVHIGDSHRFDVTSASHVGMRTILLTNAPSNDLDPPPDAVIASLGEVPQHLDRLLPGKLLDYR